MVAFIAVARPASGGGHGEAHEVRGREIEIGVDPEHDRARETVQRTMREPSVQPAGTDSVAARRREFAAEEQQRRASREIQPPKRPSGLQQQKVTGLDVGPRRRVFTKVLPGATVELDSPPNWDPTSSSARSQLQAIFKQSPRDVLVRSQNLYRDVRNALGTFYPGVSDSRLLAVDPARSHSLAQ